MSHFKKVTHVIFDLDGTLIDTQSMYERAMDNICANYRKVVPPDLHLKLAGLPTNDACAMMIEQLAIPLDVEEFIRKYHMESQKLVGENNLMPGAEKLVRHFKHFNVPIAVATSSNQKVFAIKAKKHQEFFKLFHHIVLGDDPEVKRLKPEPDLYFIAAKRFEGKPHPNKCLVFEDTIAGVYSAINAGMQVVMIPAKHVDISDIKKEATLIVKSFDEVNVKEFGLPPIAHED